VGSESVSESDGREIEFEECRWRTVGEALGGVIGCKDRMRISAEDGEPGSGLHQKTHTHKHSSMKEGGVLQGRLQTTFKSIQTRVINSVPQPSSIIQPSSYHSEGGVSSSPLAITAREGSCE